MQAFTYAVSPWIYANALINVVHSISVTPLCHNVKQAPLWGKCTPPLSFPWIVGMQEISVSITTLFITLQALNTMKSVQVYKFIGPAFQMLCALFLHTYEIYISGKLKWGNGIEVMSKLDCHKWVSKHIQVCIYSVK